MDDAQAVPLLSSFVLVVLLLSFSLSSSRSLTKQHLRVRLNIILLQLLIALQTPLIVTAETQVPATRSCRAVAVAATAAVAPQTIVVATVHHHEVVGDGGGVEEHVGGGANGKQTIAVDNTSGSPTVLYSNAAQITAWLDGPVDAVDPLATALGRRRRRSAVFRLVQRRLHSVLHVVS